MTAKEYLRGILQDDWVEPHSVQTQTALCAFAIRMHKKVEGYNIETLEKICNDCGCGGDFVKKCSRYVSDISMSFTLFNRIPPLDD